MSAYALPDSFSMPPTQVGISTTSKIWEETKNVAQKCRTNYRKELTDSRTTTSCLPSRSDYTSEFSSSDSLSQGYTLQQQKTRGDASWLNNSEKMLLISIKSASIDPIRLIQSYTEHGKSRRKSRGFKAEKSRFQQHENTPNIITTLSTSDSDECWGEYDDVPMTPSSSCSSLETSTTFHKTNELDEVRRGEAKFQGDTPNTTPTSSPLPSTELSDDVLQFNLSINLNGRDYTAARTLPSFVKLRKDLIKELSNCKEKTTQFRNNAKMHFVMRTQIHDKVETTATNSTRKSFTGHNDNIIPDLPIGNESTGGTAAVIGFAGRGFTRLQETFNSYCPAMEKWIRIVANMAPSSPILANFLWEPIDNEQSGYEELEKEFILPSPSRNNRNLSGGQKVSSGCTLNSITENDSTDEDYIEDEAFSF